MIKFLAWWFVFVMLASSAASIGALRRELDELQATTAKLEERVTQLEEKLK